MAGRIRSGSRAQSVSAVRSYLPCFFVHHACVTALLRSMTFGSRPCGRFNGLRRLPPLLFVHHACVTALLRSMTFGLRPCGRSMACGGYLPCFFVHHTRSGRELSCRLTDVQYSNYYGGQYIEAFCTNWGTTRTFKISRIQRVNGHGYNRIDWKSIGNEYKYWRY